MEAESDDPPARPSTGLVRTSQDVLGVIIEQVAGMKYEDSPDHDYWVLGCHWLCHSLPCEFVLDRDAIRRQRAATRKRSGCQHEHSSVAVRTPGLRRVSRLLFLK